MAEKDIITGEDGSITFTAPAKDITASVAYEDIKYAVTAAENTKGEVQFTEGVDEDGNFTIGTEVKFTVTAGSAYEVRTVYVNGEAVEAGDDGSYSYTMTAAAAAVTVEYGLKTFALTIANNANVTGTEISIACADNDENADTEHVHAGDVVTLKPTTKEGYSVNIVNYVIAGETVKATKTEDGYTFTVPENISGDVTVRSSSGVTKFTVTCEKPEAIELVNVPDTVNYGKSLTINVTPAGGYQVDAMYYVTADGEIEFTKNNTSENGAGEYIIANVYADGALKFVTSAREYTINNTVKTEDDKDGWVEIIDKARTGDIVTVTVTSGEGYQYIPEAGSTLTVIYVDNQTQETTAVELTPVEDKLDICTFKMPNGDVVLTITPTAEYEVSADDIMGGVVTFKNNTTAGEDTEFTKTVMAIDGDEIEINVEDAEGYSHTAVYYGDDEVIKSDSGKYIVTAGSGKTVSVEYGAADFHITAEKAEGIYDLEVAETVLGAGEYVSGAVTAADGYTVTGVKVSYGVDKTVDVKFNAKTGKFNFTMPAGNVTVTAEYEAIDYKVEVTEKTLADKGDVTLTVGGVAAEVFHVGDVVTVKTKVENGYKHTISVKDAEGNSLLADGAETSTGKSITFTMPAGDVSIEVSYQGRIYGITSNEVEYKNEDRDYTAPDGTELPTYSVAESASAGSEVVISTTGLGEKDSVQFVVTSLGEQLFDKDDNDETFTFDMPIGAVTIDVKFDIFVQEIADAQAVYAEAVAAKAITDAEEPAYNAEAIAALNEVLTANYLDESDLRSKTAEEITAAAKAITDKIAAMDLEQAKAELRAIISGVPAADEYTEESYGAVTEAVAAANALLADDAEPTVEDLNAAGNYAADEVAALKIAIEEAKAAETAEKITA